MRRRRNPLVPAIFCAALVLMALPVWAQDRGRIDLSVEDGTGAVLPGAAVAITGPENRSNIFTGLEGEAHLLLLPVGTYELCITLQGFIEYVNEGVQVRAASSTPLVVTLGVGGVAEVLLVSGEGKIRNEVFHVRAELVPFLAPADGQRQPGGRRLDSVEPRFEERCGKHDAGWNRHSYL